MPAHYDQRDASEFAAELSSARADADRLAAALERTVVTIGDLIGGSIDYARCDRVRDDARAALAQHKEQAR